MEATTTHIRPKFNELWEIWLGGERVTVELMQQRGRATLEVVAPQEVMIRRLTPPPESE